MNFSRRVHLLVVALAVSAVGLAPVGTAGAAKKRYRDDVFKRVSVTRDLVYGSAPVGGEPQDLALDLYQPKRDDAKRRPVIVWVHGGGFAFGDKAEGPSPAYAREFARKGYVTASINYRLLVPNGCTGAQGVTPECYSAAIENTHDAQAAVRWLRANAATYRIDKRRIAIGGESAGAIISCGVGVFSANPGVSGNPGPPSAVGGFVSISGGLPGGLFVDSNTAPGILFASVDDPIVPYQWSIDTQNAMERAGVPVKLTAFPGDVHVPVLAYGDVIERQSARFLFKHLDLADAAR